MPPRAEDLTVRIGRGVVAAVAAALVVSACASPSGATNAPATANTASAAPGTAAPASAAPASAAAGLTLTLAEDSTLGSFVTGTDGLTLYIFTPDTATSSACVDQCAANWPPLTVAAATEAAAGTGVTGAIGTITRPDGKLQVTLGGHPLYYFANDKAAGDVNGQGLNDKWYAAGPDGAGVGMTMGGGEKTPCPQSDRSCY
jgi:predicted lipoprotein with Yx(FWY)xxD motif